MPPGATAVGGWTVGVWTVGGWLGGITAGVCDGLTAGVCDGVTDGVCEGVTLGVVCPGCVVCAKAAPAKKPASEPPAKPRQSEAGADQLKEPRTPHHEVNQPRSAPGLQIGAKAPEVKLEQPAADTETVGAKRGEQFETVAAAL